MKRSYQNLVNNKDGTFSGVHSVTFIERISIFTDSIFTITGYYEAEEEELIELLFVYYIMADGVVPRRIFQRCSFNFLDFTRDQIDDVMHKLSRRKRPGNLFYSFSNCKVLSDGVELEDYPLLEDPVTCRVLSNIPDYIRKAAMKPNRVNDYNLKEMTINTNNEKLQFNQEYHQLMKRKRTTRLKKRGSSDGTLNIWDKKTTSCNSHTNVKKRRLLCA